jgi:alpha-galactosidase
MLKQYLQARPFFYGDYYPLTRTSANADAWAAYQLHRRDLDQGLLVLLRRTESPFSHAQFLLSGLDPTATYEFTDADSGKAIRCSGKEAMAGTPWVIDPPRSSRLVFYRRVK